MFKSAYTSQDRLNELQAINEQMQFKSMFGFLNSQNGVRRGHTHMMLGSAGSGKSSVVRSFIADFLSNNENKYIVGMLLSEETRDEFITQLARIGINEDLTKCLEIASELDMDDDETKFKINLRNYFRLNVPDIFVYDNITTSNLYLDKTSAKQTAFIKWLKQQSVEFNFALILVAHTGAEITDNCNRLIQMNDIRGSKGVVNLVEFFWILQMIEAGSTKTQTLRITKHRGQDCDTKLYRLTWNARTRSYDSDVMLEFEKFRTIWGVRNVL